MRILQIDLPVSAVLAFGMMLGAVNSAAARGLIKDVDGTAPEAAVDTEAQHQFSYQPTPNGTLRVLSDAAVAPVDQTAASGPQVSTVAVDGNALMRVLDNGASDAPSAAAAEVDASNVRIDRMPDGKQVRVMLNEEHPVARIPAGVEIRIVDITLDANGAPRLPLVPEVDVLYRVVARPSKAPAP